MKLLAKAIKIASEAFEDRLDKGGKPYIMHCLYVMNKVEHLGETAMVCAVLHDLIEDIENAHDILADNGIPVQIVFTLNLLTHKKDESYMDYVKRIGASGDDIAIEIKKADLEHNSQIMRLKGLTKKDFDRLEKYFIAYEYLRKI